MEGSKTALQAVQGGQFDVSLLQHISKIVDGRVRLDVPAASLTTLAVGGAIRALVTVESLAELQLVLARLRTEYQQVYPIGFGSNLLIHDSGLAGWGIRLGTQFRTIARVGAEVVSLGGAVSLMSVSRKLSDEGLSGLEFAAGIPASLGGAIYMNAGAHGREIGVCVDSIVVVRSDGTVCEMAGREVAWSYRSSGLPPGAVVAEVRLRLVSGEREEIARRCAEHLSYRRATQPLALPSAGSVFKNPSSQVSAGSLLERAGMKGVSMGGAVVSSQHANWIVNPEKKATADDVRGLIQLCVSKVQAQFGVTLHPEVRIWGE